MAEQGPPPDPRGRDRRLRGDTAAGSLLPVLPLVESSILFFLCVAVQFGTRGGVICDSFFSFSRSGMTEDDTLESEEMLAMLYSMAIMR